MSGNPTNHAAWVLEKGQSLVVKEAPYTTPGPKEVVVRVAAVAINPVDNAIKDGWIPLLVTYPDILGYDAAGTVFEVGSEVTRYKPGDRVLAQPMGMVSEARTGAEKSAEAGFQEYMVVQHNVTAKIPDWMKFEEACVLPLCLGTAAGAMYSKGLSLELEYPKLEPVPTGKTLLVWGGASSVGCNAIQLGVASGYEVITTCSPKNFDLVKKLGAAKAFDYRAPDIVDQLIDALKGKACPGAIDAISKDGAREACIEIIGKVSDGGIVMEAAPVGEDFQQQNGVEVKWIHGGSLKSDEAGTRVYWDFLPEALEKRKFVAAPEPEIVGEGLEYCPVAMDRYKEGGISAKKLVVKVP